jgi:hypothetical protein
MPLATRRPFTALPAATRAAAAHGLAPVAPKGRTHFLDIPFELRGLAALHGAIWNPSAKAYQFRGDVLPPELAAFGSELYSWERFKEDDANGIEPVTRPGQVIITPRPHQIAAVRAAAAAAKAGRSGFLIADDVGLGKTIETWAAVLASDADTVLIVCPLAVIAHWRRTIRNMGDGGKQVVVINYDRLKKLFDVDATAAKAMDARRKKTKRKIRTQKGLARYADVISFETIVWDESHKLKNRESARAKLAQRLAVASDFQFWLSATAGQDPLELEYLAPLFAEVPGAPRGVTSDYVAWCQAQGIGVTKGAYGKVIWRRLEVDGSDAPGAAADLEVIRHLLYDGAVPAAIRRTPADIEGWPEINRILLPVVLSPADRLLYDEAWQAFRRELELERTGLKDSKNAMVIRLRFRQKASLLRTSATVDHVLGLLEQGLQVAVSVVFRETLDVIKEALEAAGYPCAVIDGRRSPREKEAERMDFQNGRKLVCLYTVEEGISLHEGEYNQAKRSNVIHDIRWSGIAMKQVEGRTHRDGKFSQVYWMVGEDTVEEGIARVVASRINSMGAMQGDEETALAVDTMLLKSGA